MKTILYMAITPNGFIAGQKDDTSWVGKADWKEFQRSAKEVGNVVMGSRTYETMVAEKKFPIPGSLNLVMTRRKKALAKTTWKNVIFTDESPRGVIEHLKEKGFDSVLIAGGGKVSASFIADGLIDELWLTIEPIVFSKGVGLFSPKSDFMARLRLIDVYQLGPHEIQVRYKVVKK